ncbi:MAG TPA: hypothetical protein VLB68_12415 [Pyrinomonadaceae bacterium]|nr:hypothetical protein [Pyrinomonadaceae bacterium]
MALGPSEQSALTAPGNGKGAGEKWLEMLRQWLVQCPNCSEVRLVVGVHEKDRYICKDCGHSFVIGFQSRR